VEGGSTLAAVFDSEIPHTAVWGLFRAGLQRKRPGPALLFFVSLPSFPSRREGKGGSEMGIPGFAPCVGWA
jgi:hypothetical protein